MLIEKIQMTCAAVALASWLIIAVTKEGAPSTFIKAIILGVFAGGGVGWLLTTLILIWV